MKILLFFLKPSDTAYWAACSGISTTPEKLNPKNQLGTLPQVRAGRIILLSAGPPDDQCGRNNWTETTKSSSK